MRRFRFAMPALAILIGLVVININGRASAQRDTIGAIGITIYAETNFRGANANFRTEAPDLRKVGMNDRVESIRIGRGEMWEACENINFGGRCQVFTGDDPDLNRSNWGGLISSLRPVHEGGPRRGPMPPPPPPRPRLVIFADANFRGESIVFEDASAALRLPAERSGSVRAYGGMWQICSENDFWGRCEMVQGAIPDLTRIGFPGRIASARLRR